MRGMLERERRRLDARGGESVEDNLMTVLIQAEDQEDEKEGRKMTVQEVMGNAFILIFAGHETTANTLHYALLMLASRPDVQQILLDEVDKVYAEAKREGRDELEYELDFNRPRWAFAIMDETLRVYTPTGMTNKWTATDQVISFEGQSYVIPEGTRISINGMGIHFNPKVWGEDAKEWEPARWIIEGGGGGGGEESPRRPELGRRASSQFSVEGSEKDNSLPSTPDSPSFPVQHRQQHLSTPRRTPHTSRTPSPSSANSTTAGVYKPPKGTFLPFSDGARACSGKKFATVEFIAVMFTLLREHRVELDSEGGWTRERVSKVLTGRKPGGVTMQPPEVIPLKYVRR